MAPVMRVHTLKDIASLNVSIALWNHVDITQAVLPVGEDPSFKMVYQLPYDLPVPRSVAEYIHEFISKMNTEINAWVQYNSSAVFEMVNRRKDLYRSIHLIIWCSDGTINYKETARNLTNSRRLSDVAKYNFACTYCLKDEIERISFSLGRNNLDYMRFELHSLIYYWNCYLRNELRKIPADGHLSIDNFMLRCNQVRNWSAIEYFFDRLSPEEQVCSAVWLIDRNSPQFQKELLMKLNETQLVHVYMHRAVHILQNYCKGSDGDHLMEILPTWYDIRNIIKRDQFVSIIDILLKTGTSTLISTNAHLLSAIDAILTEIWASAGDKFKRYVTDKDASIRNILRFCSLTTRSNFASAVLQDLSANIKREIITSEFFSELCKQFIIQDNISMLQQLLNAWPPNDAQLVRFKRDLTQQRFFYASFILTIHWGGLSLLEQLSDLFHLSDGRFEQRLATENMLMEYCVKSIVSNRLLQLQQLLKICFPTVERLDRFKRNLTTKDFFSKHCRTLINTNKILQLDRLLTLCIPNTEELMRFKRNLIDEFFFEKHCEKLVCDNKIRALENWLTFYFSDTDELMRFIRALEKKKYFNDHCEKLVVNGEIEKMDRLLNLCGSNKSS